jgi:DNA polymerase-1
VQGTAGADILPLAAVIIQRAFKRLGLKSFFILTVHDSIVIDIVKEEVDIIADLIMNVFTNLPKYIKQYFGINWIVNLTGEIEVGPNYGTLKQIR